MVIMVALIIGGAFWWFSQKPKYTATATLQVIPAAQVTVPILTSSANQVEKPKAPVAAVNGAAADAQTQSLAVAQAELKATNQDIARMMREEGVPAAELAYAPPDSRAKWPQTPDFAIDRSPNPQEIQSRENEAQIYDNLATLTPTINSTGDKATYFGKANSDGKTQRLAIFLKIDGKWYLQLDWSGE